MGRWRLPCRLALSRRDCLVHACFVNGVHEDGADIPARVRHRWAVASPALRQGARDAKGDARVSDLVGLSPGGLSDEPSGAPMAITAWRSARKMPQRRAQLRGLSVGDQLLWMGKAPSHHRPSRWAAALRMRACPSTVKGRLSAHSMYSKSVSTYSIRP